MRLQGAKALWQAIRRCATRLGSILELLWYMFGSALAEPASRGRTSHDGMYEAGRRAVWVVARVYVGARLALGEHFLGHALIMLIVCT